MPTLKTISNCTDCRGVLQITIRNYDTQVKSHGITKRTLNTWLMLLGDEYQVLRQYYIDNMPY